MLKELIDSGYNGWVFYLDADAFPVDLTLDVRRLIAEYPGAMVMSPGGLTGYRWDVNDGVFLIDLGSGVGRRIVTLWHDDFMSTPDEALRTAAEWHTVQSDQPRLHRIFQENADLVTQVTHVPREIFNNEYATFVRQILRDNADSMAERLDRIRVEVAEVLAR